MSSKQKVLALIETCREQIDKATSLDPKVSAQPVGWHLAHVLQAFVMSVVAMQRSDPKTYKPRFNLAKLFIFSTGLLPRGKAKAPAQSMPKPEYQSPEMLGKSLQTALEQAQIVEKLDNKQYFNHPIFGHLNPKGFWRLHELHIKHHLKIIKDICK